MLKPKEKKAEKKKSVAKNRSISPKISLIRKEILPLLQKNAVIKAGIFGSYARGEERKESDIDILVQFKGRKSLFDLMGLEQELEKKMRRKVDLLTYKYLHPALKEKILKEEIRIL
ncbi:MAG: nucleotidyltransferase family protein [Nanoarchaeota archaeon]